MLTILSTLSERIAEENHITTSLLNNGYPRSLIKRASSLSNSPPPRSNDTPPSAPKATIVLPYIKNTSEAIRRILAQLDIRVCFQPNTTLRKILSHPKDTIPNCEKPGVVYSIPCSTCDLCYIGQTGRTLTDRKKEHMAAVKSNAISTSALAEHSCLTGHKIAWDHSRVLAIQPHWDKRCYLESWTIRSTERTMNSDYGSLSPIYNCLL